MSKRIVCLASLYEPMEFLKDRLANFNQCDMSDALVYFVDVSTPATAAKVEALIKDTAKFEYKFAHHAERKSLYWVWSWIIEQCTLDKNPPTYYCNTNCDDLNSPEYFSKMSKYLDDNKNIQIVATPWGVTNTKHQRWPAVAECGVVTPDVNKTCGHFPMWRAALHKKVGLFHKDMVCIGDADFWLRIKRAYGREAFAVHPETLGCYLSHDSNLYHTSKGPNGQKGESWDRKIMKQRK